MSELIAVPYSKYWFLTLCWCYLYNFKEKYTFTGTKYRQHDTSWNDLGSVWLKKVNLWVERNVLGNRSKNETQ